MKLKLIFLIIFGKKQLFILLSLTKMITNKEYIDESIYMIAYEEIFKIVLQDSGEIEKNSLEKVCIKEWINDMGFDKSGNIWVCTNSKSIRKINFKIK